MELNRPVAHARRMIAILLEESADSTSLPDVTKVQAIDDNCGGFVLMPIYCLESAGTLGVGSCVLRGTTHATGQA